MRCWRESRRWQRRLRRVAAGADHEPLSLAVYGGATLFDRRDHNLRFLESGQVGEVTLALAEVSADWLRERFDRVPTLCYPSPARPGDPAGFDYVWGHFERLREFFRYAAGAGLATVFSVPSCFWRPPREDGGHLVRPPYRAEDYTVDPNSLRALPRAGGDGPFEWELTDRDGVLYDWTEVERFRKGGRMWVRLTKSRAEYYIDVEIADDRIGRIECVHPLIAYWQARRGDPLPVVVEQR